MKYSEKLKRWTVKERRIIMFELPLILIGPYATFVMVQERFTQSVQLTNLVSHNSVSPTS